MVDKSRKSPEQVKLERELFWYRDALLKTLHATWVEVSKGSIYAQSFAPIHIVLNADRLSPAQGEMDISAYAGNRSMCIYSTCSNRTSWRSGFLWAMLAMASVPLTLLTYRPKSSIG